MSYLKALIPAAGIMGFAALIGWLAGGSIGVNIAVLLSLSLYVFVLWRGDSILINMHEGRLVHLDDPSPVLRALSGDCLMLARKIGMPYPRIYIVSSDQPNAFVAGRDMSHASLIITTGLLSALDRSEMRAVLSRELANIRRGDALLTGLAAIMAILVAHLCWFLGLPFGRAGASARFGARLVARLLSPRSGKYGADRDGAEICGTPAQLASALEKIEYGVTALINPVAERNPSLAHIYIVDPLREVFPRLSACPPLQQRIVRLRQQAAGCMS